MCLDSTISTSLELFHDSEIIENQAVDLSVMNAVGVLPPSHTQLWLNRNDYLLTLQEKALHIVIKVLLSFKSSDIEGAVQTLDQNRLDTLMKYIYRGFEIPSEGSSAQLLTWHEKVSYCNLHLLNPNIFWYLFPFVIVVLLLFVFVDCSMFWKFLDDFYIILQNASIFCVLLLKKLCSNIWKSSLGLSWSNCEKLWD